MRPTRKGPPGDWHRMGPGFAADIGRDEDLELLQLDCETS